MQPIPIPTCDLETKAFGTVQVWLQEPGPGEPNARLLFEPSFRAEAEAQGIELPGWLLPSDCVNPADWARVRGELRDPGALADHDCYLAELEALEVRP